MLLQDRNDLLFRVTALLHPSPPVQITRELQFSLAEFFGGRSHYRSYMASRIAFYEGVLLLHTDVVPLSPL